MEKEAKTKKELIEDLADLRQQLADVKKPRFETKNFQQELQASKTRYRHLFETAQDGILILNAETGQIDDVNPCLIDMLHYSHEEFMGMKLWEVSPFKNTVLNRAAFEELQDKGYIRYKDLPLQTKEGKPIAVEFVSNVYKANGNKMIQCNIRNITENKEAKQKLQEAVLFQQRLIDALPVPVFYKDSEGRYLGCNSSFEKFFGQKREQVTGKSVYELSPKEFADIDHEKDRVLLQNPGIQIYESTVKDAGGVVHNVIFHKATFPNRDDSVGGLIGGIIDITDSKRAEEGLHHSEGRLHTLLQTIPDLIWLKNKEGVYLSCNTMFERFFGAREADIVGKTDYDFVGRELADSFREHDNKAMAAGKPTSNEDWITFADDGHRAFVETIKTPMYDSQGKVIGVLGIGRDITDSKRAEEGLRHSEGRLHTLVQTIPDLIWLKNKEGVYLSCNTMFERFFGVREADIVGKTDYDFVGRELADSFREHDNKAMAAGKPTSNEEWITFADGGHRVFVETIKTPMYDSQGTLIGVLGIGRDITDRRAVEQIRKALGATIHAITVTVEARDPYTAGHQRRVADLARSIAMEMNLPDDQIDGIRMAATIHDLGKISVPAEILSKPTKLTNIELMLIKTHSQSGYDILKDIDFPWPVAKIILEHHERMNGSGYPNGLTGNNILLESRILAVADVLESMASHRPYRPSLGIEAAMKEIESNRGILYDINAVNACLRLFREKGFKLE